jgi:precorrin-3B C17-methyltransferase
MADIVYVVGLGPGDPQFLTAQAQSALEEAEVLCGTVRHSKRQGHLRAV